jgi:formate hydrogenlyase subunit 3/multisubunit Na+/H+ antiporter MnhD subunit
MLLIPVFVPLVVGFVLLFIPTRILIARQLGSVCCMAIAMFTVLVAFSLLLKGSGQFAWTLLDREGIDLCLLLRVDALRAFILMFATVFGLLIALYSFSAALLGIQRVGEYYGSILLAIGGSAGILLTDHILCLLIFWEIVTVALYLLITTGGRGSAMAATKSFAMLGASDAALLLGLLIAWQVSGTTNLTEMRITTQGALPVTAFLLILLAALTKAGAMPLHTWLPVSGQSAPSAAMALLPAALDKLLGIYLLVFMVKEMFVMIPGPLTLVLTVVGAGTIIAAVMVAMVQHNIKRLLSYHAISQVGYMVLGIATGTPIGIAGGLFHMLNHAIYKSCLFLCGGAVEQQTGTSELDELGGLGRKMPVTFAACFIAALSISGLPPLNGFVSKWMVYQGILQMGSAGGTLAAQLWPLWLVCAMFGSALTLASFVKILHSIFLSRLPERLADTQEVPPIQAVPMGILAILCVFFGVFYHVPLRHFIYPALQMEPGATMPGAQWDSLWATILLLVGVGVGVLVLLGGGILAKKIRIVHTWTCGERQPNEQMIIPGTHFYKTVSSMNGLRQIYQNQEKGYFDPYKHGGTTGLAFTGMLKWLHNGVLSVYLTWVVVGLLLLVIFLCQIQ